MTMTPGPDTLLVLRNCVRGGRRSGAATALGAALGSLAWAAAAAVGLAAALQRWDAAFTVVRLAGAAYLVVLGGQALGAHRRAPAGGGCGAPGSTARWSGPRAACWSPSASAPRRRPSRDRARGRGAGDGPTAGPCAAAPAGPGAGRAPSAGPPDRCPGAGRYG